MDIILSLGNRKVPSNIICKCGERAIIKGRCGKCHRKVKKKRLEAKNEFSIF